MKQRVEYVDLAKGLCILIIALTHTYGDSGGQIMEILSIFKIPVFFMLSGFFFRQYDSFYVFFKKKTNQLLIPVLFSFLFFSLIWTVFFSLKTEEPINVSNVFFLPDTWKINFGLSPSTWFLVCLFQIFIISYFLYKFFNNRFVLLIAAFAIGGFGYYLNVLDISLPIWMDTAITTIPFFVIGRMIWTEEGLLQKPISAIHYLFLAISFFVIILLFYTMDVNDNTFYAANRYTSVSFVRLYVGGFFGSIFMILISKFIGRLPVVSYIGRYSIVVLITHQFYLFVIRNVLYQINIPQDSAWVSFGVFIIVVLISLPTIKYSIKYLPYCFAQKELLH